ncbi:hypothetical protein DFJ77DRAFT_469846 [Powellomyces hirtus]|nr:hypothetical protein DFJ77DRAFT_469846 [Powellomyces hirtus]
MSKMSGFSQNIVCTAMLGLVHVVYCGVLCMGRMYQSWQGSLRHDELLKKIIISLPSLHIHQLRKATSSAMAPNLTKFSLVVKFVQDAEYPDLELDPEDRALGPVKTAVLKF